MNLCYLNNVFIKLNIDIFTVQSSYFTRLLIPTFIIIHFSIITFKLLNTDYRLIHTYLNGIKSRVSLYKKIIQRCLSIFKEEWITSTIISYFEYKYCEYLEEIIVSKIVFKNIH